MSGYRDCFIYLLCFPECKYIDLYMLFSPYYCFHNSRLLTDFIGYCLLNKSAIFIFLSASFIDCMYSTSSVTQYQSKPSLILHNLGPAKRNGPHQLYIGTCLVSDQNRKIFKPAVGTWLEGVSSTQLDVSQKLFGHNFRYQQTANFTFLSSFFQLNWLPSAVDELLQNHFISEFAII